ncbi:InlB B-repeat-containing protein [Erysipelothrix anatis]|uniref:InlB B-repeat-containing protein n=1 Tax=Erysipelothrix anatis TaxID=2683713 RepID=UPI00140E30FE|nr:InlB B-repeat-containing protein [Erysipelothrix anatis]
MEKLRIYFKRTCVFFFSLLFFVTLFLMNTDNISASTNSEQEFQKIIVEEALKLQGKVKYDYDGIWYDVGSGYSQALMEIECNAFVRRSLVNAVYKARERKIDIDPSYNGLLQVTGDGLDLRGRLMTIENATGKSMLNVPRNLTNPNYTPNMPEVNKYMDSIGAGAVVYFKKPNGDLHWGLYTGKIDGKHMVVHASTINGGYNSVMHEEISGMWKGKGTGYIFEAVYNAYPALPELGYMQIEKVNEQGIAVPNAVFSIYQGDKITIVEGHANLKTNNKGIITSQRFKPGTYYAREVSAPNPYILDNQTWWRFDVVAGKTVTTSNTSTGKIVNKSATGIINVEKKSETGVLYAGVTFQIKNSNGVVVDTITTSVNGKASSKRLPLGRYTVVEISAPKELFVDSTPKTVNLVYSNQTTPTVYTSALSTNKYKPVITYDIHRIKIDTKKASEGLVVNAHFNKTNNYDYSLNDFSDTLVNISLVDTVTKKVLDSKDIKGSELQTQYDFLVQPSELNVNNKYNYEIVLSTKNPNKIELKQSRLSLDGYTASELTIREHADISETVKHDNVIRTERYFGREMITYKEYFEINVERIQPLRAGRGFKYDVLTYYKNDLDTNHEYEFEFIPNKNLVDESYSKYINREDPFFEMVRDGNKYQLPHVRAELRTGEIITQQEWLRLNSTQKERYRDGGNKLYTPFWSTDVGKYDTLLKSSKTGINQVTFEYEDYAEIFAYMFGWYDENGVSPSADWDGIVTAPVLAHNPFPTGIPDNWGFVNSAGKRELTATEQEFFGNDSDLAVIYNLNGGTNVNANVSMKYGETHTITEQTPTKEGSRFMGWVYNGAQINSGQKVDVLQDTVIAAQWDKDIFEVTFNTEGGSTIHPQKVHYGNTVRNPKVPSKQGYKFFGWDKALGTEIKEDTVFNALWEEHVYDVHFNTGGGTRIVSQEVPLGAKIQVPLNPTKEGLTFIGWDIDVNQVITKNTTYTALWETAKHKVYFDSRGGSEISEQIVLHNQTVVRPIEPTRRGVVFAGWDLPLDTAITKETIFTAKWEGDMLNVSFDTMGGTRLPDQKVLFGDSPSLSFTPTKAGHDLVGWSPSLTTEVEKDTVFTALWEVSKHIVEFDTVADDIIPYQIVEDGKRAETPLTPQKDGYRFVEWAPNINQTIKSDTVFTAKWILDEFDVHFNTDGGNAIPSQKVKNGSIAIAPANPTKTGYTFDGWTPSINTVITGHTTFTAKWTVNRYNVTFNSNGGSSVPGQVINHGSRVTTPANPTRTGHTFSGWSPSITNVITGNTTFTAQWVANRYTVTYNANGGSGSMARDTVTYGSRFGAKNNTFTRSGYTFAGWNERANGSGVGWAQNPNGTWVWDYTSNVTLYAQWTPILTTRHFKSYTRTHSGNSNYQTTLNYTLVYRGDVLLNVEYAIVTRKLAGTGYWNNANPTTWSVNVSGVTHSGSRYYDFRNGANTGSWTMASGTIQVNKVINGSNNTLDFNMNLPGLGTVRVNGSGLLSK